MEEDDFWSLLAESAEQAADVEGQARWLTDKLATLPGEQIRRFDTHLQRQMIRGYRWDLWGVASLANGHEDQEGFVGFRAWLVSRGQTAFEAALEDPDSLAPIIERNVDGTALTYTARNAHKRATGAELPTATLDLFAEPRGEPIQPSDLTTRFPKVAAALG